jgi:RimJ/RimL family protein N-acetyltransferase
MNVDIERVRVLWRDLTGAPEGFRGAGVTVVGSAHHRAAPDGWIGIVKLATDVVIACPVADVDRVLHAVVASHPEDLVAPDHLDHLLNPCQTLGPALLFYGAPTRSAPDVQVIGPVDLTDDRVRAVLTDATDDERDESDLDGTSSGAFVALTADGTPAAACAWAQWPHDVAHISSLTATAHRGQGFGLAAAHLALSEATNRGLIPQWRAAQSNLASIALARRLGLHHLGTQYSCRSQTIQ